jgi:ubiquitin-like-conjugating enzyme ATG10
MGSSSVWDGTLSPDEFSASAKALVAKWGEIDVDDSLPDWAWRPCCKMGVPSEVDLTSSLCAILVIMVFFLV